jgi:anti-sigma B factor antagonist
VIIRRQNRGGAGAAHAGRAAAARAEAARTGTGRTGTGRTGTAFGSTSAAQLKLSRQTGTDGRQVVSVTGELDIATAQQAYAYLSDVIDHAYAPVSVDLAGLTFCDASGLGVLAKVARRAADAGRQLMLTSARPSLLKIMRITGMDSVFPELCSPAVSR